MKYGEENHEFLFLKVVCCQKQSFFLVFITNWKSETTSLYLDC